MWYTLKINCWALGSRFDIEKAPQNGELIIISMEVYKYNANRQCPTIAQY